jgi:16S rRNA (adenine1518-N6/adenine1519-N6)-dimethyltransferase
VTVVRSHHSPLQPGRALSAGGIRPAKSKGQNFLTQGAIADRIVGCAELTPEDEVIEIGPGLGILSERIIAAKVRRFSMIELDRVLAAQLRSRFSDETNAFVIEGDFLKFDLNRSIEARPIKVIGNLPFNVAAAVLRRLGEDRSLISRMVLMFQREVGRRIRATPAADDYGALSVFTAMYWLIEKHFVVAPGSFHPMPKVAAEVLSLVPNPVPGFERAEESCLLRLIRAAFSAPRKMLRNNLLKELGVAPPILDAALHQAAIDPRARAQLMALTDFTRLMRALPHHP